jgi:hypothetical protein
MHFTTTFTALAALAFGVTQADVGCTVDLTLSGTSQDNGERIVYGKKPQLP